MYKKPKKDKGLNAPHFMESKPHFTQQADLLYLPNDNGYKYALVVVDVYDGRVDAKPLKTKKATEVLNAFKNIYKKGILKKPHIITFDEGREFKGPVKKWFQEKKVQVKYAQPGRHRQVGFVESKNKQIALGLFKRMTAQEILTGVPSFEWVEDLPKIIAGINEYAKPRKKVSDYADPVCEGDSCTLLDIGTKVRVALDNPITADEKGKRLHGKFRATDIRWSPEVHTITNIYLNPGAPPLYQVDNGKVAYTKNQLQVVPENEKLPPKKVIRGKPDMFKVEKILDKKKMKGRWYYLVKWVGFDDPEDNTWELATKLREDVPDIVASYEKVQKNKNIKGLKKI